MRKIEASGARDSAAVRNSKAFERSCLVIRGAPVTRSFIPSEEETSLAPRSVRPRFEHLAVLHRLNMNGADTTATLIIVFLSVFGFLCAMGYWKRRSEGYYSGI